MFTNTQYVHRVNKPAYREERRSQTHNMFTQFSICVQDRKMFKNTQNVHKPVYWEERCSQTHNMFTELTNQHTGKKDVHKHTICSQGSQPACGDRKMFTNTQYVHRVNKPAYREERCSQTHNMFTGFTTSIQGRKMFTNTQYVHRVNKPAYREERCSQTHNMFTRFTKPACRAEKCSQTYNSQWEQCPGLPSNNNIIFVGWGMQCDCAM